DPTFLQYWQLRLLFLLQITLQAAQKVSPPHLKPSEQGLSLLYPIVPLFSIYDRRSALVLEGRQHFQMKLDQAMEQAFVQLQIYIPHTLLILPTPAHAVLP